MSQRPRLPAYLAERSLSPIANEQIPTDPPETKVYFGPLDTPDQIENLAKNVHIAVYLSYDLIEYAWRLTELSWERRGQSDEGMELPASSRACAAGAIAVAYAALEAAINEDIVNVSGVLRDNGDAARARLVTLAIGLPLRSRLDALAATYEHSINWGTEPLFQRLTCWWRFATTCSTTNLRLREPMRVTGPRHACATCRTKSDHRTGLGRISTGTTTS